MISSLAASMFLIVFVFGCVIDTANADAMDTDHGVPQTACAVPMPTDGHANDHTTTALSLPQSPDKGILLNIRIFLLFAFTSALTGILAAHTILTQNIYLKKERVFLYNPAISLFRTGIVNPKIF